MTRARSTTWGLWLLLGCGATEGPLLHASDAGEPEPSADAGGAAVPLAIANDAAWQYQLVGEIDVALELELFVVDLFDVEASSIAALHAGGARVVAYLSAGTFEPFRADAGQFPAAAIGNALPAYPNEAWLDVRADAVRALMAARLDVAAAKGFDGVLSTSLTAYASDSGFPLTAADQRGYTSWLAAQTRARGLSAGMSGDFGQSAALAGSHDFAIHFGCIARDDCDQLEPLAAAGKPVFDVETEGEPAVICAAAAERGVNALLKQPDFGAYRVGCE